MNEVVEQMLEKYNPQSTEDYENALKEILQEITLQINFKKIRL